jgi:hypothetical protein
MTWFMLLSSTLVDLYLMHNCLVFSEIASQGVLMDAEEAFYKARNFEHDFKRAVAWNTTDEFLEYWSSVGELTYGVFSEFPEKGCKQTDSSFIAFLDSTVLRRHNIIIFSPMGFDESCITLEVEHQGFKTYGVVVSTVCINTSSPLLLC